MVVVAYAMSARGPLMQCRELDDFRVLDFKSVIFSVYSRNADKNKKQDMFVKHYIPACNKVWKSYF